MRKMSTKAYVIKYELNKGTNFNVNLFSIDFINEFTDRIINNDATRDYIRFERTISEARSKYDAINNKTSGDITDKIWGYMYATTFSKAREKLFPDYGTTTVRSGVVTDEEFKSYMKRRIEANYYATQ